MIGGNSAFVMECRELNNQILTCKFPGSGNGLGIDFGNGYGAYSEIGSVKVLGNGLGIGLGNGLGMVWEIFQEIFQGKV